MRALVALSFALVAVLAGCVSPGADLDPALTSGEAATAAVVHGPDGLPALSPAMAAAVGAQFLTGIGATEPTVGVTSDGSVFMTGFTDLGVNGRRAPTILRSQDKGVSWEDVGPRLPTGTPTHATTNDPYVYVDPATDRVFDLDLIGTACSFLSWSDDLGASWTTNPLACGTPGGNDHQTIVAATPRLLATTLYPNIVYYCVNRVADTACATSLDGGLTFTPLKTTSPGVDMAYSVDGIPFPLCGGTSGHLKSGPDGKVYLPKAACSVQPSPPVVYVTEDDGLTWSVSVIAPESIVDGHEVAVAIDEENNVFASWQSQGLHYFAASFDGAKTWTAPRLVTAPGVTATEFNAIAAGKRGHVAIAYIGTTVEGGYEGKGTGNAGLAGDLLGQPDLPEWDNATWNAYIAVITDATSEDFTIQTVTANDPADPVARGLCGRTRCGGMSDFIDLVIDAEGRPWASFVDVCHADCIAAEKPQWDAAIGFAGTLRAGPALRGEASTLPQLPT